MGSDSGERGHDQRVDFYVDSSKSVGDAGHLKVFVDPDAALSWFRENDPEGVAFEYG